MLRRGARCISASRVADVVVGDGGLLSVTLIRRASQSLRTPGSGPGRISHAAFGRIRASAGVTDSMTTDLADQDGGYSGNDASDSGKRPLLGEPASGKDPL